MNPDIPSTPATTPTQSAGTRQALIRYPRFKELHQAIQLCQALSRDSGEAHCMALGGLTGTGKTTLVRSYAEAHPRLETAEGSMVPVLYVETPSPATIKSVAAAMLRYLGDPRSASGTLWSMNERLVHFIHATGAELIIMDDFHHLFDDEAQRALCVVSDWLKVLIKETGVPFLVVGLEDKLRLILKANPQLSRLFACREVLHPFPWNPAAPKMVQDFSRFIDFAQEAVGVSFVAEVPRLELLHRLHLATDGVVGHVVTLLRQARMLAERRRQGHLDLAVLSLTFRQRLQEHLGGRADPFTDLAPMSKERLKTQAPDVKARKTTSLAETLSTR
jgi:hypothetical protein